MDIKELNQQVITQFRSGGPVGGMDRDRILLLTTTGRRSGATHTTPMMFHRQGARLLVIASNNGAARHPEWYLNLLAQPEVEVEIGERRYHARATPTEGLDREQLWSDLITAYPFTIKPGSNAPSPWSSSPRAPDPRHLCTQVDRVPDAMGTVFVVTGASSGIGRALARFLTRHGVTVVGLDRHDPPDREVAHLRCDLGDPRAVDAAVDRLDDQIDALANVAGLPGTAPAEQVLAVNFLGTRHLTERLLPRIRSGGSVVNVSSAEGRHWVAHLPQLRPLLATRSFEEGMRWYRESRPIAPPTTCPRRPSWRTPRRRRPSPGRRGCG